jgi:hypothetical protein
VCMTADQIYEAERSSQILLITPRPDTDCAVMKCN